MTPSRIALRGVLVSAFIALATPRPCAALPSDGAHAPDITLTSLDGETVSTSKLAPRAVVLIFGELEHKGVRDACADTLDTLAEPRFAGAKVVPVLIVAGEAPEPDLKALAGRGRFPSLILHDPKRDAFGAYDVVAIPTVVVVDGSGAVVHSFPGYLQRPKELLGEALLAAIGKQTREQFERAVDQGSRAPSHDAVRAGRLVQLGNELARQGLFDLAEARFKEARTIAPDNVDAMVGLGELMLRLNRPGDAAPLFRSALAARPDSEEAALGLAEAQLRGGSDGLDAAERAVKAILEKDPGQPRAHYLLGIVDETRGDLAAAAGEYRRAAELLMER